ncbi:hypothetical protein [Actinoplanes sp. NPDC026670]|uniref:hypothetical protein n=1 Tax=Actinoplanes sp. NPDC026670 TaxID=3154700 RepID=UPI0033CDA020
MTLRETSDEDCTPKASKWIAKLYMLSAGFTAGVSVNVFSDYTSLKGLAIAAITVGGLGVARWLRKRPRSQVAQYSKVVAILAMLSCAFAASILSSTAAAVVAILAFVGGAVVLISQVEMAAAAKLFVKMIAAGMAAMIFGSGLNMTLEGPRVTGIALTAMGIYCFALYPSVDRLMEQAVGRWEWDSPIVGAFPSRAAYSIFFLGQILFIIGFSLLQSGSIFGAAIGIYGAMSSLEGVAYLMGGEKLLTVATIISGLSISGAGAFFLFVVNSVMWGAMGLALGMAFTAIGIGRMRLVILRFRQRLAAFSREPDIN